MSRITKRRRAKSTPTWLVWLVAFPWSLVFLAVASMRKKSDAPGA